MVQSIYEPTILRLDPQSLALLQADSVVTVAKKICSLLTFRCWLMCLWRSCRTPARLTLRSIWVGRWTYQHWRMRVTFISLGVLLAKSWHERSMELRVEIGMSWKKESIMMCRLFMSHRNRGIVRMALGLIVLDQNDYFWRRLKFHLFMRAFLS